MNENSGSVLSQDRPDDIYFNINNFTIEKNQLTLNLGQNIGVNDKSSIYLCIENWMVKFTGAHIIADGVTPVCILCFQVANDYLTQLPLIDFALVYNGNTANYTVSSLSQLPKYYKIVNCFNQEKNGKNLTINKLTFGISFGKTLINPANVTAFSGVVSFSKNYSNSKLQSQRPGRLRGERRVILALQ